MLEAIYDLVCRKPPIGKTIPKIGTLVNKGYFCHWQGDVFISLFDTTKCPKNLIANVKGFEYVTHSLQVQVRNSAQIKSTADEIIKIITSKASRFKLCMANGEAYLIHELNSNLYLTSHF